ncbi:MAG: hypothetical protein AB8B72_06560 [Crocinitomicaceae bacterium]
MASNKSKILSSDQNRTIKLLPLLSYKSILVIIDKAEQIRHNQLHHTFPSAEFTFLTIRTERQDKSSGKNYTFHSGDKRFGKVKNDRLLTLLSLQFDLLMDLSHNKNLKYFCRNVPANLKAGCFNSDSNYNLDLLVNNRGTVENLIDGIAEQIHKLTLNNKE